MILQRKKNQSIMIGDDVEIVITEIKGDHVKVGIKAPAQLSIFRKEIFEEIKSQNKAASTIESNTLDQLDSILSVKKKNNKS